MKEKEYRVMKPVSLRWEAERRKIRAEGLLLLAKWTFQGSERTSGLGWLDRLPVSRM